MTAPAIRVTRELGTADDPEWWPIFHQARSVLPADLWGVVSIEAPRGIWGSFEACITDVTPTVTAALSPRLAAGMSLWVFRDGFQRRPTRLGAYYANRYRLWNGLEADGVELPEGERVDELVEDDDRGTRFAGAIRIGVDGIDSALRLIRPGWHGALLLVPGDGGPDIGELHRWSGLGEPKCHAIDLAQFIPRCVASGLMVAFVFGYFDDPELSFDVFGMTGDIADVHHGALAQISARSPVSGRAEER